MRLLCAAAVVAATAPVCLGQDPKLREVVPRDAGQHLKAMLAAGVGWSHMGAAKIDASGNDHLKVTGTINFKVGDEQVKGELLVELRQKADDPKLMAYKVQVGEYKFEGVTEWRRQKDRLILPDATDADKQVAIKPYGGLWPGVEVAVTYAKGKTAVVHLDYTAPPK
jgi:hypothetical protein